jgi:3-oxoacyl-[acyl-carrier protein] reductase
MMFDLTGMTALVTGASGGIGSAVAKALADQGAQLALSGTREEALKAVATEIGGDCVVLPCNLSDTAAVDALVPRAVEALGKLDILVNNAGVTRDNLVMRMKDEEWDQVIAVNLSAAFRLIRAASKPMMKARFGRIITITSVVGATGNPGQANYAASKGGLTAMSKAGAGTRQPQHYRQLRRAGVYHIADDGCLARRAERSTHRADSGRTARRRR